MSEPAPEASVSRIILRPLGSPLTIGMSGLAIALLVQCGLDLHWVSHDQTRSVGLILISVPFLLQTIACVFSYLARDGATGATVGVLSGSWLAEGLIDVASSPGARSGALGLMLLAAGGTLALSAVAVGSTKPLAGTVFLLAALRFIVGGVYELGAAGAWQDAAGLMGLAVVAVAGYCVLAFELEGQQHRPVLPTFRRGTATATPHHPDEQFAGVVSEPGIRHTT